MKILLNTQLKLIYNNHHLKNSDIAKLKSLDEDLNNVYNWGHP
jgi:hypothetical protein